MTHFESTKGLLDEINKAIAGYDPILKEKARDILLREVFGSTANGNGMVQQPAHESTERALIKEPDAPMFSSFLKKWFPKTQADKALLSLYYLQRVFNLKSVKSRQVNNELKEHGIQVRNISVTLGESVKHLPPLARQMQKSGKNQQERSEYAITVAGIQYVESRLNRDASGEVKEVWPASKFGLVED